MEERKIEKIIVDQIGGIFSKEDAPITPFLVNGEMASVLWYKQGKREFNGKYVIEITYVEEEKEEVTSDIPF